MMQNINNILLIIFFLLQLVGSSSKSSSKSRGNNGSSNGGVVLIDANSLSSSSVNILPATEKFSVVLLGQKEQHHQQQQKKLFSLKSENLCFLTWHFVLNGGHICSSSGSRMSPRPELEVTFPPYQQQQPQQNQREKEQEPILKKKSEEIFVLNYSSNTNTCPAFNFILEQDDDKFILPQLNQDFVNSGLNKNSMNGSSSGTIIPFGACVVVLSAYLIFRSNMKKEEKPHQSHNNSGSSGGPTRNNRMGPHRSNSVLERFSSVLNKAKQQPQKPPSAPPLPLQRSGGPSRISRKIIKGCEEGELRIPQLPEEFHEEEEDIQIESIENMETGSSDEQLSSLSTSNGDGDDKAAASTEETDFSNSAQVSKEEHQQQPSTSASSSLSSISPPSSRPIRVKPGILVSNRFQVEKEVGRGGFSKVYLGKDQKTGKKVAIKTGSKLIRNQTESLKKELAIYKDLQKCSNAKTLSIPNFIHYTEVDIKRMGILVMDLLGPSLEDLFTACDLQFSLGTVAIVMKQMLDILQFVHGKGYLHRDIKPENILVGRLGTPEAEKIFLIDFGTVGTWQSNFGFQEKHVSCEYGHARLGTNSYMSLNAHRGKTLSRKDDLEALGYVLIRLIKKEFPWSRYDDMSDEIREVITAKMKTEMEFQTEFPTPQYPEEIQEYLKYVKELPFEVEPDYNLLKERFEGMLGRLIEEGEWDGLEWMKPEIVEKLQQH